MTLYNISPNLKSHRTHLNKLLYNRKLQLANAYASGDSHKIVRGKIGLIRILLELHGSPELGPQLPFNPGWRLELMLAHGADSQIKSLPNTWYGAADVLASSLYPKEDYDPIETAIQQVEAAMEEKWNL